MSDLRIIKKYPNRRLYDTTISSYITLADVKKLVMDNVAFIIQEAKSSEDITRTILLQIIVEQEERGDEPMLSNNVLEELIRFYGGTFQGMMGSYLERSFKLFAEQQTLMSEQIQKQSPLSLMSEMADRNLKVWKDMQEGFFGNLPGTTTAQNPEDVNKPDNMDKKD